ncbi:Papain-like cysteine protease C1 [Phytophthora cinnamomi]|uniref:Papain-like cysteine protease C1 n=1 Tax=Phytophthora cinnamomi TaxID=4785 RepID=UPI00355A0CA8|nr:Papain-like cysteine protease C1 [Phytophthora cinnamomi]
MQPRVSTAAVALAIAVMAAGLPDTTTVVDARPMHAAIVSKYHRYLEEKDNVSVGLKAWLKKWGPNGHKNGYIPVTESRSLDDELEDQRQRFYLTQEQISEAREANPMAIFSTDGPFTLMTMEEFKQFLSNSHVDEAGKVNAPSIEKPKSLSDNQNKQNDQNNTPSSAESKNKASKHDGSMRRLRTSGKSQYAFNGGTDYSADAEKGYQSTSDSYTQTSQPTYQGTVNSGSNGGNTNANTNTNANGAWNFGDVSTGDSSQVGTVSTGSPTGPNNQAWNWRLAVDPVARYPMDGTTIGVDPAFRFR